MMARRFGDGLKFGVSGLDVPEHFVILQGHRAILPSIHAIKFYPNRPSWVRRVELFVDLLPLS
jgi:hypothetical protein